MTFNTIYSRPSSLATIAGNYREPTLNAVVNVNTNGVGFAQSASTGCVMNGSVGIIDARFNAYRVEYTFASCRGSYAHLNGTTARGIGTLDNSTSPERAIIGVVNTVANYSLVLVAPRT